MSLLLGVRSVVAGMMEDWILLRYCSFLLQKECALDMDDGSDGDGTKTCKVADTEELPCVALQDSGSLAK